MIDPSRPIYTLTVKEFRELLNESSIPSPSVPKKEESNRVYGLLGLSQLLGCSRVTAQRIKNSGVLDPAISQIGRKIIVDADMALELVNKSKSKP